MLLNMSMVVDGLGDLCCASRVKSPPTKMSLSHAELFEEGADAEPSVLYLARAEDLQRAIANSKEPQNFGTVVALADEGDIDSAEDLLSGTRNDFAVVSGTTLPGLLREIQRIFGVYDDLDQQMKKVIMRKGTVADLVAAASSVTAADILVHDRDFHTIAYRTNVQENNPLSSFQRDEPFNRDLMAGFEESARRNIPHQDPFSVKGPTFWKSSYGPRSLNMNIFLDDHCVARVAFTATDADREPRDKDVAVMLMLGSYIRAVLTASFAGILGSGKDALTVLIGDLIDGKSLPKSAMDVAAKTRCWNYWTDNYILLAAQPSDPLVRQQESRYPLISVFSRMGEYFPESHSLLHGDQGLVLINLTRTATDDGRNLAILERIARESDCIMGISRTFMGLRHVRQAFEESLLALGCEQPGTAMEPGIVFIDDVILRLVDESIRSRIAPLSFCPKGLLELIRHDNRRHTQLYPTVRAFVESSLSPTKTAKALFIQRSTLHYRLEKALSLLDMDLEDPEKQLQIRLAFRLLDTLPPEELAAL